MKTAIKVCQIHRQRFRTSGKLHAAGSRELPFLEWALECQREPGVPLAGSKNPLVFLPEGGFTDFSLGLAHQSQRSVAGGGSFFAAGGGERQDRPV